MFPHLANQELAIKKRISNTILQNLEREGQEKGLYFKRPRAWRSSLLRPASYLVGALTRSQGAVGGAEEGSTRQGQRAEVCGGPISLSPRSARHICTLIGAGGVCRTGPPTIPTSCSCCCCPRVKAPPDRQQLPLDPLTRRDGWRGRGRSVPTAPPPLTVAVRSRATSWNRLPFFSKYTRGDSRRGDRGARAQNLTIWPHYLPTDAGCSGRTRAY